MNSEQIAELKKKRDDLIQQAAKAAYDYARECDVGKERIAAFEVYETVLHIQRTRS